VIATSFTLTKENGHHFRHIDAHEPIEVTNSRRECRKNNSFCHTMRREMFSSKRSYLHVEFDHKRAIESLEQQTTLSTKGEIGGCENPYAEYSKYDKEDDLKEMPITAICDLEQHKLSRSERIHHLE
jgi:hypothetical protein